MDKFKQSEVDILVNHIEHDLAVLEKDIEWMNNTAFNKECKDNFISQCKDNIGKLQILKQKLQGLNNAS